MQLNESILNAIDKSVLCWLATVSEDGMPNVSPKELFLAYENEYIAIANIASPNSVKNITFNPKVCVSFVDILVQKGYQLKGEAQLIGPEDPAFIGLLKRMPKFERNYPIHHFIKIKVDSAKPIVAPSYWLYPNDTTEEDMKEQAKKQYLG